MKLQMIETYATDMLCMTRVTDEDGAQGWGMTAPFSADITAKVLHRLAAPIALECFDDFRCVADEIMRRQYKFLGTFIARAAAGVDTALWDMEAKKRGLSVADFSGKKRDAIDLYASSMKRDLPVQEEADRMRALQDQFGYRALKLHPGIPVGKDHDHWPGRTEDMVRAMMRTAAPDTHVIVDVNGNYSVERAIEMAKFLHDNGVKLFEEPCPYWEIEKTKAVRDACVDIGIPVAGGEQDYVDSMWARMIDQRVMDVCQPDLLYVGGFSRALRVAEHAAKKGLPVTPHTSNQSPIFVMGLHYMACVEHPYPFLECGIENDLWESESYEPHVEIKNGRAAVPGGPGWGFEPTQAFLKKAEYAVARAK